MVTIFWENYSKLCDSVGKSSSKVAKELGLSSGTPTPWKKDGVIPQDRILNKIAEYFHVDSKSLVSTRLFGSQYTNDGKTTRQHEADGLSDEQQELIRLIPTMTAAEVSVLLATARGQVAARTIPGVPSRSE